MGDVRFGGIQPCKPGACVSHEPPMHMVPISYETDTHILLASVYMNVNPEKSGFGVATDR